ncbi:acetyl-CoA carboxylase biotin carboxylase subunit [Aestuariibacter salexigens]|uniref:acetyl-CoA carboxylase biotin carboxylase subunit n=1 Tax=Aestuariibacter salexigens TaxID=226010 RepID=UPI0003F7F7E7|nr:acetyl/propionyl/methylcrotonyl-CoA carboxylase subunit alpha [Aestuariibacter salexigens]
MFNKLLIANRGEISCRVIKTARKMGIRTVAVYSDADANALHVQMADEAFRLGPAPSRDSYLQAQKIIDIAKQHNVDAIHPGYGFLSENSMFAKLCSDNGIAFVGPPVLAIDAMGSKSAAKRIMQDAGVPLVPGYHGDDQSAEIIKKHADDMGYPVLLKAAAGGGGKGMRQVWSSDEFDEALAAAKREAMSSFNDDIMLVEKYLTQPRHVEIQVFCDNHGNGVYLHERDCSVQRRHQKVIEEAPAPGMSDALRKQMGEAALRAANAIDYRGAGTVEFLLDADGQFYFMEMNTRLQVEHPVTEMITGLDLVEWQLRVANNETLPLSQAQIPLNGHAFEARIYAEDPDNNFLPATGTLQLLKPPVEGPNVRVDTGVSQGDEVSVYYDPMIAKLIVWDENRDKALARLCQSLRQYHIEGLTTNIDFLYNLAASKTFAQANLTTDFIDRHQDVLNQTSEYDLHRLLPLATLTILETGKKLTRPSSGDPYSPWSMANHWRANETHIQSVKIAVGDNEYDISVQQSAGEQDVVIVFDGQTYRCQATLNDDTLLASINGHRSTTAVASHAESVTLFTADEAFRFRHVMPDLGLSDDNESGGGFSAPMNGTVVSLNVEPGVSVKAGQTLMIMEAMKMEHAIKAPSAGVVKEFFFKAGELVDGGAMLLEFDAEVSE